MIQLLAVAKEFGGRPSSYFVGLTSFEAYCFDEAALVYVLELREGHEPVKDWKDASTWLL